MTHEHDARGIGGDVGHDSLGGLSPGKRTRSEGLPVQRRAAPATDRVAATTPSVPYTGEDPFAVHLLDTPVQRQGGGEASGDVHAAAARGIAGAATSLPFLDQIQASFGAAHDVGQVQAHVGGAATEAAGAMGATAYATGNHVAFAGAPDLHTAAHEAAHVVQQAQGVNLYGGVGEAGDHYERQADAVADRVVAGASAADLLGPGTGGGAAMVQRQITRPTVVQRLGGKAGPTTPSTEPTTTTSEPTTAPSTEPTAPPTTAPDPKAPVAKLHLLIDVDVKELGLKDLTNGSVGHTWISLEYLDPHAVPDTVNPGHKALLASGGKYSDPMGFWPDTRNDVYYNPNPFNSWVQGWMRHPDRAHEGSEKAVQTWTLTQAEVDAVIAYAESKNGAKYSVYFFNCTTFGAEAVKAAGKSPPSVSTGGICFPNAAYDGIKARQAKGQGNTWTKDLDTDQETSVEGPDGKR